MGQDGKMKSSFSECVSLWEATHSPLDSQLLCSVWWPDLSVTGTYAGPEPTEGFHSQGSVSLLKMKPHPSLDIPSDPTGQNWCPYLPFSSFPGTSFSQERKGKASLMTTPWTCSVAPALGLFQPCT